MKIVGVKINEKDKTYYFDSNNLNLEVGVNVIVEAEKGLEYGKVVFKPFGNYDNYNVYGKVIRISQKKDDYQFANNVKDANNAYKKCKELITRYKLNMKLLDATYVFDRSQLIFRFLSDDRIDFRQLARELGSIFKTRIELRQVGIRDKAKVIGGLGPCGRILCCSKFLTDFETITINMAKNQMLALNPSKINGTCGRLLCCLNYENDIYMEYKKELPEVGQSVMINDVPFKVISLSVLNRSYLAINKDNVVQEVKLDNEDKK
mgnify:CR=1 FL=1